MWLFSLQDIQSLEGASFHGIVRSSILVIVGRLIVFLQFYFTAHGNNIVVKYSHLFESCLIAVPHICCLFLLHQ